MAVPPILLPYGFVGVYGEGLSIGMTGLTTADTTNRFATVYFIGSGMDAGIVGSSVLFKSKDEVCRLSWDNYIYPIIPSEKIIGTEVFL